MRGQRTLQELAAIDAALAHEPAEPILRLWERLMSVGGMPALTHDHAREIGLALKQARDNANAKD